jgi:oligopeptidase B
VLEGREGGITRVWVLDKKDGSVDPASLRQLEFAEDLYEVGTSANREYDTSIVRLHYSSLTSPIQWLDVDMNNTSSEHHVIIKEQQVLNFDRTKYVCKRVFATAPDKTQIPISIVHRKDLYEEDGKEDTDRTPKPCMLYGYGSYGICIDPDFNAQILPYLDRGMIYAIAHVRGGGEMGRYWYEEQGKYLTKRNTFQDFISCAEHLVAENITAPEVLAIEGRSAGGLLMGNVINMRPDLFQCAVAGVPFVDLMTTMCDPSIPLTTGEWEEWGNPNEAKYFDYMLSYSPYDNVRAQPYPHVLITAGLHDPRVAYWEPAKWASKLRSLKTDDNEVIVKMDLDSGHFSASDRYKYLREKAFDQAFVLDKLGLANTAKKN